MGDIDDVIPGPPPSEIKSRTVRGVAVVAGSQFVRQAIQLGTVAVMARLLTPRDYGLIGMVLAFTALATIFSSLGLSAATVQRQDLNERQVSTLFWVNAGFGAFLALVVAGAAPVVAWFYGERELLWIGIAMGAQFVIAGLQAQHGALLSRRMQFGRIAAVEIVALLCGSAAGITSALAGWGPYALVAQSTAHAFVRTGGFWIASGWLPGPPVRGSGVRQMFRFGGYFTGFNFLNYFTRNMDKVLVGWYCGAAALGLYRRAYALLMLPIQAINAPISRVFVPALSRLQNDHSLYRRYYCRAMNLVAYITTPLLVTMVVLSEEIVLLLLGEQWVAASKIFKVLAIAGLGQPMANANGWIYLSLGQTDRMFRWGLICAPLFMAAFVVGLPWGVLGVAVSYAICVHVIRLPNFLYAFRYAPIGLADLIRATWRPVTISLVMYGAMETSHSRLASLRPELVFLVCCLSGSVALLCCILALPGARAEIASLLEIARLQAKSNKKVVRDAGR